MKKIALLPVLILIISAGASAQPYIAIGDPTSPHVDLPSRMLDFDEYSQWSAGEADMKKALLYDQHTLADEYDYNGTTREFQWDKIRAFLDRVDRSNAQDSSWAVLENYKNEHDRAPLAEDYERDDHNMVTDRYGVIQNQSVPVYAPDDLETPERYGRDGSLVEILATDDGYYKIRNTNYGGQWFVPQEYVRPLEAKQFHKVIFVDRTNQNIATVEKVGDQWLVRSMNPATTGLHKPPYQYETPSGIFVLQDKKPRMMYLRDGTSDIAGYAPYANRFTNGAYIHGVPVNNPNGAMVEFSNTLGTTPRSHMCVRNATSHAKFVYDNFPADQTVIIVID